MAETYPAESVRLAARALRRLAPGFLLSAAVAAAAVAGAPHVARVFPIPAMVLALILGILLNRLAAGPRFQAGLVFCVKQLLRWAVALLGLRIALGDIAALGVSTGLLVVGSMTLTILSGFLFARLLGLASPFGALAGSATAVCGASAALATVMVLPAYRGREADVIFVVIAVNALSTLAMVFYGPLAGALGFDQHVTGVFLGATIHDVAQVVGAGYAVSEAAGNTAVIVKLFRVFLLLPVVLAIGWWFARPGAAESAARVPMPLFAFAFLALCIVNSVLPSSGLAATYAGVKGWLVWASTAGLLIAISALGLGTSVASVTSLGWRHMVTVVGTTAVVLAIVAAALLVLR